MKLLDEKLVEEAAKEWANKTYPKIGLHDDWINDGYDEGYNDAKNRLSVDDFKAGVSFAEQQLKEKMIEFAEWCTENYLHKGTAPSGKEMWIDRDYYIDYKTTEQLFEQFLNKE